MKYSRKLLSAEDLGDDKSSLSGFDEPWFNPNIKATCVHTYEMHDMKFHAEGKAKQERYLRE